MFFILLLFYRLEKPFLLLTKMFWFEIYFCISIACIITFLLYFREEKKSTKRL